MEKTTEKKYEQLKECMAKYIEKGNIIVAFSGGVDSALLLKLACEAGGLVLQNTKELACEKNCIPEESAHKKEIGNAGTNHRLVYAVTVETKLHPAGDTEAAVRLAKEFGAVHKMLKLDELKEAGIENNPVNRCYLCKKSIFSKIKELAETLNVNCILEGTNEDDLHQYRPGIKALQELGIISPLAECGLTKAEIRIFAERHGISVANKPSMPCLATRLPYGAEIHYELLQKIDEGERYLRGLGFYNVRLRVYDVTGGLVRIEVDEQDLEKLLFCRKEIVQKIKRLGFTYVTVDLEGFRTGSMDELMKE